MNSPESQTDKKKLVQLLQQFTPTGAGGDMGLVSDEDITLLATGHLGQFSAARRRQILLHVARDPVASRLVKELCDLELDSPSGRPRWSWSSPRTLRSLAVAWAVAASLMIGMFAWQMMDPGSVGRPSQTIQSYGQDDPEPDYWSQVDKQRLDERALHDRLRSYALVASTSACLVLSVGLVVCFAAKRKKRRQPMNSA